MISGACRTRLLGEKTWDDCKPESQPIGVPFRMSKPVYVVERKYGDDGEVTSYDLAVEYRSDPNAVYWVNIDSALFHSTDFKLTFLSDGHGTLQQVTTTGTDKSKGFFELLGSFAATALSIYVATEADEPLIQGTAAAVGIAAASEMVDTNRDFDRHRAPWPAVRRHGKPPS